MFSQMHSPYEFAKFGTLLTVTNLTINVFKTWQNVCQVITVITVTTYLQSNILPRSKPS